MLGQPVCGNDKREGDEVCDGSDLAGNTCASIGFGQIGDLVCKSDCSGFNGNGCGTPCTPDCSGVACGPDPICGISCGSCSAGVCVDGVCRTDLSCPEDRDCTGRACGPDPVCSVSCGTCTTGSCNSAGQCEGGGDPSAPVIISLSTNITSMEPDDTLTFSAVVTDPDGIDDLIGGTLSNPGGGTYGSFATAAGEGAYALSLSWSQIDAVEPIPLEPYGVERRFLAEFFDQAGHSTSRVVDVTLRPWCPQYYCQVENSCVSRGDFCHPEPPCGEDTCDSGMVCAVYVNRGLHMCAEPCPGGSCADGFFCMSVQEYGTGHAVAVCVSACCL